MIPAEFRPAILDTEPTKIGTETSDDDDDDDAEEAIGNLFLLDEEEEENVGSNNDNRHLNKNTSSSLTVVKLASHQFVVQQLPDKGTFFAHQIWSSSKLMGEFLLSKSDLVGGKSTVEFGAGSAIPSLCALSVGSKCSVITDYPDEDMLQAIRETVGHNWEQAVLMMPEDERVMYSSKITTEHHEAHHSEMVEATSLITATAEDAIESTSKISSPLLQKRVQVVGHEWGTNVINVREALKTFLSLGGDEVDGSVESNGAQNQYEETAVKDTSDDDDCWTVKVKEEEERIVTPPYFDVALLSECLWNHEYHNALATSLNALLHPTHGVAILTYCHHIPGLEEQDDAFFHLCVERYGMKWEHIQTSSVAYMWDATKQIDSHLCILKR